MSPVILWFLVVAVGYLLGCFSSGYIIARLTAHVDIRKHGSGNAGTTNVFRVLGAKQGLITLIGDLLKAVLAVLFGLWLCGKTGGIVGALCCILGHDFPVFMKFKGGKGVACTAGAMLLLQPLLSAIILPITLGIIGVTRIVSVASIFMSLAYMVGVCITAWGDWLLCGFTFLVCTLTIVQHHANIKRLFNGTEKNNRLDFSKRKN